MLKCGLVILNYIDYKTTTSLINTIKDFAELDHIVIVDNASPNDSYQRLKSCENDKISVIQSGRNGGYAFGNNVGVNFLTQHFGVDIIGIANPDVVFSNELVRAVKQTFADNTDYAILTGLQVDTDGKIPNFAFHGKDTVSSIIKADILGMLSPLMTILRIRKYKGFTKYIDAKLKQGESLMHVWEVNGSLFFARAEDFVDEGLFDEGTFMYREEEILAARVERMGKKEGVISAIKFVHLQIHHFSSRYYDFVPRIKTAWHIKNSKIYYFNTYVTSNKLLHVLNACLAWLNLFKATARATISNALKMLARIAGIKYKK